jgi:hypothetical protein
MTKPNPHDPLDLSGYPALMTAEQVADVFAVDRSSVARWGDRLISVRTPGGTHRYLRVHVQTYMLSTLSGPSACEGIAERAQAILGQIIDALSRSQTHAVEHAALGAVVTAPIPDQRDDLADQPHTITVEFLDEASAREVYMPHAAGQRVIVERHNGLLGRIMSPESELLPQVTIEQVAEDTARTYGATCVPAPAVTW